MRNSNVDGNQYIELKTRIQESLEHKNNLMKNLKYSIHHATKVLLYKY